MRCLPTDASEKCAHLSGMGVNLAKR